LSEVFGYMDLGLIFRLACIYVERVDKLVWIAGEGCPLVKRAVQLAVHGAALIRPHFFRTPFFYRIRDFKTYKRNSVQ
jgi:hypothetical protein